MDKIKTRWSSRRSGSGLKTFIKWLLAAMLALLLVAAGFVAASVIIGLV